MSADPDEQAIEVEGLVNAVGAGQILHKNLNLKVRRDEVMTLVGGSGSGKTQLLRVILGLKRPVAGSVRVFGVSWDDPSFKKVRDARRRMGMLFQNGALFSALTVFDNVAFPLRERGGVSEKKIRAIVHAKLSEVELVPHHGTLLPASLSGGMVKRVALARALALAPDLLILDEPTAGLDPDRSERFVQLIKRLRADHRFAVFMVTHDLDTLYGVCDRVAALADGRIVAHGPLSSMLASEHPWVKAYFQGKRARAQARSMSTRAAGVA